MATAASSATPRNILPYAQLLHDLGYNTIPGQPGTKQPKGEWADRQHTRLTRDDLTRAFAPDDNLMFICGGESRVAAIDCDDEASEQWFSEHFPDHPFYTLTGSGRMHLFFRAPQGALVPTRFGLTPNGGRFEVRSEKAALMGHLSVHPDTGRHYVSSPAMLNTPVSDLPVLPESVLALFPERAVEPDRSANLPPREDGGGDLRKRAAAYLKSVPVPRIGVGEHSDLETRLFERAADGPESAEVLRGAGQQGGEPAEDRA